MSLGRLFRRLCAVAALMLTTASLARADFPHSSASGGLNLTPIAGNQLSPSMVPDESGGFIVTWNEDRDAYANSYDIYAQRVDAFGREVWASHGVPVCAYPGSQNLPLAVADGMGGAVLLWRDERLGDEGYWAQRVNRAGVRQWAPSGIKVLAQTHIDYTHQAVTDGAGGIWFVVTRDSGGVSRLTLQHVTASGALPLGAGGLLVRSQSTRSLEGVLAPDGLGGVLVAWSDFPNSSYSRTVVQRYSAAGLPQWPNTADALWWPIGGYTTEFTKPVIEPDGAGGCFVAARLGTYGQTSGLSLYTNHVSGSGAVLWGFPGIYVASNTAFNDVLRVTADGLGGLLVGWRDSRFGAGEAVVQRLSAFGTTQWAAGGLHLSPVGSGTPQTLQCIAADGHGGGSFVSLGAGSIYAARISAAGTATQSLVTASTGDASSRVAAVTDGDGGMFVTWDANQPSTYYDLFAGRIDRYGLVGANGPRLRSIRDVALDQGGLVKLNWDSAWLDNDTDLGVSTYRVWRSVPTSAPQGLAGRRPMTRDADEAAAQGWLLADGVNAAIGWELVGSQPAALLPAYSFVAPTLADSVAAGVPWTTFRVEAISSTAIDAKHWWSVVDSAYSVDDLAPAAPGAFSGTFGGSGAILQWRPSTEADFATFRLYRGVSANFTPSPATLLAETASSSFADAASHPYVYKLVAVDVHGNVSPASTVTLPGVTGVDGGSVALAFDAPSPSPARARTTLRWALPVATHVRISLHDVAGRCVRTVVDEPLPAGVQQRTIACEDDAGRALPAGVYVVNCEAPGVALSRKLLVVR